MPIIFLKCIFTSDLRIDFFKVHFKYRLAFGHSFNNSR